LLAFLVHEFRHSKAIDFWAIIGVDRSRIAIIGGVRVRVSDSVQDQVSAGAGGVV
jgi:hypothetical protein